MTRAEHLAKGADRRSRCCGALYQRLQLMPSATPETEALQFS